MEGGGFPEHSRQHRPAGAAGRGRPVSGSPWDLLPEGGHHREVDGAATSGGRKFLPLKHPGSPPLKGLGLGCPLAPTRTCTAGGSPSLDTRTCHSAPRTPPNAFAHTLTCLPPSLGPRPGAAASAGLMPHPHPPWSDTHSTGAHVGRALGLGPEGDSVARRPAAPWAQPSNDPPVLPHVICFGGNAIEDREEKWHLGSCE